MARAAILASQVFIVVLLVGALAVQLAVLPALATEEARRFPEVAYLKVPITALAVLVIACGEVALLCVWKLLSMVRRDSLFSTGAYRYVNIVLAALVTLAVLLIVMLGILIAFAEAGGPGVMLALIAGIAGSVAASLVVAASAKAVRRATQTASLNTPSSI